MIFAAGMPEGVSVNRTVPVGVVPVLPPEGTLMLAVNVTDVLIVEVLPVDEELAVRLVEALLTTCVRAEAVELLL